ncbi:serine-rich adhesin for platelets-like [Haliotis cracherodii]|uniref:serine-rich adhesin for platelets-like n=1 Tax=Haliotis cracherodii TaxID=6455 RepID=UPI0039E817A2
MSQELAEQYNTDYDVANNNQPEWNKFLPRNGLIGEENKGEGTNVYSGTDTNERHFAGNNLQNSSKQLETRFSNIQDGLESSITSEGKERVNRILNEVNSLSDVEKLLLYLKLPTGASPDDSLRQTPTSFLHSSNRIEQAQAFTWIRSHLEEDSEICVPKHEVYDDYRLYCESHNLKPLCPADFGKVMKCVFPNVKPRRLGQRGQSKYCYSGLRKKLEVQPPSLPELEITPKKEKEEKTEEDEVYTASRQLVCEWAHKLLGTNFNNLRELAEFLVGNLYVNSKSTAAFTVLAAMQDAGLHNSKVPVSSLFTCTSGGNKHKETQLQLQRKLQERELIKEQKRRLQQQRSENERENDHLRSQSLGHSPSPFQLAAKSAARNITKLLQSPGAGDNCLKTSPHTLQEMIKQQDRKSGVEASIDNHCNGHSDMDVQADSGSVNGRQSDNGQYHVVKKPAVRPASQLGDISDKAVQKTDVHTDHKSNPLNSNSETNSENGHFALPTTPSRSAFVPVSNQRKDFCSTTTHPNSGLIDFLEESGEDKHTLLTESFDTDSKTNGKSNYLKDMLQRETSSDNKSSNSPVIVCGESSTSTVPSSPQTPKKSRSRFTPIRPKITPTKTVSSILKDHKNANGDGPAYDSRPVSAILKEKRAREAQEILTQLASNVQLQSSPLPQGMNVSGPVSSVSSDVLKLPLPAGNCSNSNEVFIIVGSPKAGTSKVNSQSITVSQGAFDIMSNTQFPPNVTAPMPSSVPLTLLLAKQEEMQFQGSRQLDSNSQDNSDLSDNGNITDSDIQKSDESQDMIISRDTDTPSGRKRKSSDRDVESKTKRMNSTDVRNEEDEVFLPPGETQTARTVDPNSKTVSVLVQAEAVSCGCESRASGGKLSVESLESDALLDSAPMAVDQDLVSSLSKPNLLTSQTASIGISAKSMRSTQKQLLQQKLQLDQRVSNYLSKGHKSSKEIESVTQQLSVVDKSRVEQILQQYIQHQQKPDVKSCVAFPSKSTPMPNNQPVNLLSLLQRPVFDSKKSVLSSVSKSKEVCLNIENSGQRMASEVSTQIVVNKDTQQVNSNTVDMCEDSSDLPSDVADFITENMAARDNSTGPVDPVNQQMKSKQTVGTSNKVRHLLQTDHPQNQGECETDDAGIRGSTEQFTVPSTPPPRQKELTSSKPRFATVQRSASLPMFAPLLANNQCQTSLMTLGKGLDMPAPPNRVIDSNSPQPLLQKSTTPISFANCVRQPSGRQRQNSIDRLSNHTPMSDAGYHSFDASPVMNSTPIPPVGTSDNLTNNASNTSTNSVRSDSAQSLVNESVVVQSPIQLASPQVHSARSTPSSIMSPQMASHNSINTSPSENITSPNSFIPIQGGLTTGCSTLSSPQLVTPIKPMVTVAASPSTVSSVTFSSSILMQLTSNNNGDPKSSLLFHHTPNNQHKQRDMKSSSNTTDVKESSAKTGVLHKLLNSKSLPSYEEAVHHLGRINFEENGTSGTAGVTSVANPCLETEAQKQVVKSVNVSKPVNVSLTRSISVSENDLKLKPDNSPDTQDRTTTGSDGRHISTSEYPFSYQLALLREKCLNPPGKENKSEQGNNNKGQSVQRMSAVNIMPSELKTFSNGNSALANESKETKLPDPLQVDSTVEANDNLIHGKANVTHHHYGTAAQKLSSLSQSMPVSSTNARLKASTTVIKPSASPAYPRTFSTDLVPSIPSNALLSTNKPRQLAPTAFATFDLPNVNYMGNAPNIDLGSILQGKQGAAGGLHTASDSAGGDRSRLTLMQALQPTQTINEEELQSTLEILRSLDSQYFSQSDLDLDTMQPSLQQSHQSSSQHELQLQSQALSVNQIDQDGAANSSTSSDTQEQKSSMRSFTNNVSSR